MIKKLGFFLFTIALQCYCFRAWLNLGNSALLLREATTVRWSNTSNLSGLIYKSNTVTDSKSTISSLRTAVNCDFICAHMYSGSFTTTRLSVWCLPPCTVFIVRYLTPAPTTCPITVPTSGAALPTGAHYCPSHYSSSCFGWSCCSCRVWTHWPILDPSLA